MNRIRNVLFDLDGTLVDPKEGITRCIQYALVKMGRTCPSLDELIVFIGPPLRNTFKTLLNANETDRVENAVTFYWERYTTRGIYENIVFPDVLELLAKLHADSFRLFVVTTKPTVYAEIILRYFSIDKWFEKVFGTEMDGFSITKQN
jgi:phosphoglycolate phosphatase